MTTPQPAWSSARVRTGDSPGPRSQAITAVATALTETFCDQGLLASALAVGSHRRKQESP
jgi:hypothetical protein